MSNRRMILASLFNKVANYINYTIYGNSVVDGDVIKGVGDVQADGTCIMPIVARGKEPKTYPCLISSPLHLINGVADEAYYNGITRKIGVVDMGTLNWNYSSTFKVFASSLIKNAINNLKCVGYANYHNCGSLPWSGSPRIEFNNPKTTGNFAPYTLICYNKEYTDVKAFKAAINGVKLYYQLETPTTEECNMPKIRSFEGIQLTTDTEVKPSNVVIET